MLLTGLAAALVTALLPPVPAVASPVADHYHTATSTSDNSPRKGVTVSCPEGQIVYGFGGATVDSDGNVALVGIFPSEDLTTVTAIAQARGGWVGNWSVRAAATCWAPGDQALQRIVGPGGWASCPGGKMLYSSGYAVSSTTGSAYADAVVPSPDLSGVYVRGGGAPAAGLQVTAVALCGLRMPQAGTLPDYKERTEDTVPVSAESTTTTVAPLPQWQGLGYVFVFGAGVSSTRPGMFIDALGPGPELAHGWARMSRGTSALRGQAMVADDEDEVTVYGVCIGSWY